MESVQAFEPGDKALNVGSATSELCSTWKLYPSTQPHFLIAIKQDPNTCPVHRIVNNPSGFRTCRVSSMYLELGSKRWENMNNTRWTFASSQYYERYKERDMTRVKGRMGGVLWISGLFQVVFQQRPEGQEGISPAKINSTKKRIRAELKKKNYVLQNK